jgi:hypothetical protein
MRIVAVACALAAIFGGAWTVANAAAARINIQGA